MKDRRKMISTLEPLRFGDARPGHVPWPRRIVFLGDGTVYVVKLTLKEAAAYVTREQRLVYRFK